MPRLATLLVLVSFLNLSSCQWLASFREPQPAAHRELKDLEKIAKTKSGTREALEAAREGAEVSFLEKKDYKQALYFYKYLVLYSDDEAERRRAQKHLAEIYFERLASYEQAIVEYNRLLQLPHSVKENTEFRMNISKSYFYLSKFSQAEAELDLVVKNNPTGDTLFDAKLLYANIYLSTKNVESAIEYFRDLMNKYPQKAKEEHVGLSLAVCFEEKNDFKQARAVLKEIRGFYPNPDFIDLKIQRLQDREEQLPGAHGLRK